MDLLQEAFTPFSPGDMWAMFFYGFTHFNLCVLDCVTQTPADYNDFYNVLYNSDWIHLKKESHMHLGLLEG